MASHAATTAAAALSLVLAALLLTAVSAKERPHRGAFSSPAPPPGQFDFSGLVANITASANASLAAAVASHPLDALTWRELQTALALQAAHVTSDWTLSLYCNWWALLPPPKAWVLKWTPGSRVGDRVGEVFCYNSTSVIRVTASLSRKKLLTKSLYWALPTGARRFQRPVDRRPSDANRRWNTAPGVQRPFFPVSQSLPYGHSFQLNRSIVTWGAWRFHVRYDPRAGVILSQGTYTTTPGTSSTGPYGTRSVFYEIHASELAVPYFDPQDGRQAYFDEGDFGLGRCSSVLIPNNDCPANAVFIHGAGIYSNYPNAICIFERYTGNVAWRHTDWSTYDTKPAVTLVVRTLSVVGNYDYFWDYEFSQDGSIKPSVQATGYPEVAYKQVQNLKEAGVNPLTNGTDGFYGSFVDPFTVATFHEHMANYKLDLDIDGVTNAFVKGDYIFRGMSSPTEFGDSISYAELVKTIPATEDKAVYNVSIQRPAEYLIVNTKKQTSLGNAVGYRLVPGNSVISFRVAPDAFGKCIPWGLNNIYVTQQADRQRWASGTLVPCSRWSNYNQGLQSWIKKNRTINSADVVLWYTVGLQHTPSQEEWPRMAPATMSFELRPHNFFERNPLLFLPSWTDADVKP